MLEVETKEIRKAEASDTCFICGEPIYSLKSEVFEDSTVSHLVCANTSALNLRIQELETGLRYVTAKYDHNIQQLMRKPKRPIETIYRRKFITKIRFVSKHKRSLTIALKTISRLEKQIEKDREYVAINFINLREFKKRYLSPKGAAMKGKGCKGKK